MSGSMRPTLFILAVLWLAVRVNGAPVPGAPDKEGWKSLFDGESLAGWKKTAFTNGGEVAVQKPFRNGPGAIVVSPGDRLSGFNWTKEAPKTNYELTLESLKIKGDDFMCGLTFPVGDSHASLILGGWGGTVVGISSIDGADASENQTAKFMTFATDQWYRVKLRVTPKKIEAWVDDKQVVDQEITGRKISLRPGEMSLSTPIGISTFQTSSAFRAIRLRSIRSD
jgi:hypothetical protein